MQTWSTKQPKQLLTRSRGVPCSPLPPPSATIDVDDNCRGCTMRLSNADATCCLSEGAMNSKRWWQWARGRLPDSNPKGGSREQNRSWARLETDAYEARWDWWDEGGQGKHSVTGWLTKLTRIFHFLHAYWVIHQLINEYHCNLFHNYSRVRCCHICRSQWLCCTQLLNPRSLCLHFDIHCPLIFVVSCMWRAGRKIKCSSRTGVLLSNAAHQCVSRRSREIVARPDCCVVFVLPLLPRPHFQIYRTPLFSVSWMSAVKQKNKQV